MFVLLIQLSKMKNDLTPFEKDLLKSINRTNKTRFTYRNLMGWASDKAIFDQELKADEVVYRALGCYVAINPFRK